MTTRTHQAELPTARALRIATVMAFLLAVLCLLPLVLGPILWAYSPRAAVRVFPATWALASLIVLRLAWLDAGPMHKRAFGTAGLRALAVVPLGLAMISLPLHAALQPVPLEVQVIHTRVAEPATVLLMLGGLLALAALVWRTAVGAGQMLHALRAGAPRTLQLVYGTLGLSVVLAPVVAYTATARNHPLGGYDQWAAVFVVPALLLSSAALFARLGLALRRLARTH